MLRKGCAILIHVFFRMNKDGVVSYAYIFYHYNLIKAGSQVSKKILKPTQTDATMDEFDTRNLDFCLIF